MIDASDLNRESAVVQGFHGRFFGDLSGEELAAFVAAGVAARRRLDVLIALGAVEVEERDDKAGPIGGFSRRRGQPSARRKIAEELGGSEGEAEKLLTVGRLLKGADDADGEDDNAAGAGGDDADDASDPKPDPDSDDDKPMDPPPPVWLLVAAAVREGRISTDKAEAVTRALEAIGERALPGLEAELVAKAELLSLRDLRRAIDTVIAEMDRKALKRRQEAQHGQRHLRLWEGRDGMTKISGILDPETALPVKTFLDNYVRQQYTARRQAKDRGEVVTDTRTTVQMNADALATMALHLLSCGKAATRSATTVVVRAERGDLETELGLATSDQMHTPLTGHGLRKMACAAGLMPMLSDGMSLPQDYGRTEEFFTLEQRLAMLERDGGCAHCHAPASWCEAHHVIPRHLRGPTSLRNGVMLCTRCHHDAHRYGWDIDLRQATRPDATVEDQVWITLPATIDPTRTPRLGGKAALRIANIARDPLPDPDTTDAEHEDAVEARARDLDTPLPAGIPF